MARTNLGYALAEKGFLDDAIKQFRETLRINPEDAAAHYALGVAFNDKGLCDEAIKSFEDFVRYGASQYADKVNNAKEMIEGLKNKR